MNYSLAGKNEAKLLLESQYNLLSISIYIPPTFIEHQTSALYHAWCRVLSVGMYKTDIITVL